MSSYDSTLNQRGNVYDLLVTSSGYIKCSGYISRGYAISSGQIFVGRSDAANVSAVARNITNIDPAGVSRGNVWIDSGGQV